MTDFLINNKPIYFGVSRVSDSQQDDYRVSMATAGNIGSVAQKYKRPQKYSAWRDGQRIRSQMGGSCVGQAVSWVAQSEGIKIGPNWVNEPLSPYAVWMGAKELYDPFKFMSTPFINYGTTIKAGLMMGYKVGFVYERFFPSPISEYDPISFMSDCDYIKIRRFYNLQNDLGAMCDFIAKNNSQIVVGVDCDDGFMGIQDSGVLDVFTPPPSPRLHACVISAYEQDGDDLADCKFEIVNSWGEMWGKNGRRWVTGRWLKAAMFEAYGLAMSFKI